MSKSLNKQSKTPLYIIGILIIIGIFSIILITADIEFSNGKQKTYDKNSKKVTIRDFSTQNKIGEIQLIENTDYCLINCHAILNVTLYNRAKLIDSLRFKDLKKNVFIKKFKYDILIQEGDINTTFPVYQEVCENVVYFNETREECSVIQNGTRIEIEPRFVKYQNKKMDSGNYIIKITGKIGKNQEIDWLGTWESFEIEDWAVWNSSFEVDITAYYNLDETSGADFEDIENGFNGTMVGNGTWNIGKINNARHFDGTGDYGDLGGVQLLSNGTTPFTISVWINLTGSMSAKHLFILNQDTQFVWWISGTMNAGFRGDNKIEWTIYSNETVHNWTYFALVYNGSAKGEKESYHLYRNGTLYTEGKRIFETVGASGSENRIGTETGAGSSFFLGEMDEIGIWNRSLSSWEILDLYNEGAGLENIDLNITLNSPANYYNSSDIWVLFNCSAKSSTIIQNISLWINSTGTFAQNISNDTSWENDNSVSTTFNLSFENLESDFIWNCRGEDDDEKFADSYINRSLKVDFFPTINITSPSASVSSATIFINATINDTQGKSYCYYNITKGVTPDETNTELDCNDFNVTLTLDLGDGTYMLWISGNDTIGQTTIENKSFILDTSVAPTGNGGGGGGGAGIVEAIIEAPPVAPLCMPLTSILEDKWAIFMEEKNMKNFKGLFKGFLNYWICHGASSIIGPF